MDELAPYLLLGTAAILFGVLALKLRRDFLLARYGTATEGRIVAISKGEHGDYPIVRFVDDRGRAHEFESDLTHNAGDVKIGLPVTVLYDAVHPKRARQVGTRPKRALLYASFTVVACAFVLLATKSAGL